MIKAWRWKKQILSLLAGCLLFAAAQYADHENSLNPGILERGGYGEEPKTYELLVEGIGEKPFPCRVEITSVQYSSEEANAAFEEILSRLPSLILGDNESLNQVKKDLNLVTFFEGTGVRALWQSKSPQLVDSYGRILSEEISAGGEAAVLIVTLTDGRYQREEEIGLTVLPPFETADESLAADFAKELDQVNFREPEKSQVTLPKEFQGRPVSYRNVQVTSYWVLPILGAVIGVLLYGQEKAEEEKKKKRRRQLLMLDYADVVYQLMVYIGAGLTAAKAWEYIVDNYERGRKQNRMPERPAYEEMALTLGQMQCGLPEGKAVSEFGRRCNLQPYMKLSSLLEQNRRTGTKNLNQLLEQEMTAAWEEQKHTARRMGEEAKTKLLVPLFLMLLVVMVIIMVPALMVVK